MGMYQITQLKLCKRYLQILGDQVKTSKEFAPSLKGGITSKIRSDFKSDDNENTTYPNLWDAINST